MRKLFWKFYENMKGEIKVNMLIGDGVVFFEGGVVKV